MIKLTFSWIFTFSLVLFFLKFFCWVALDIISDIREFRQKNSKQIKLKEKKEFEKI